MTVTVTEPPAPAKARTATPRLDLDRKIDLLCALCQIEKPGHRRIDSVPHLCTGELFAFHPGKVLNTLIDYVLPNAQGQQKPLAHDQSTKLYSLHWFEGWKRGIATARSVGPEGAEPLLNEKVQLLLDAYMTVPDAVNNKKVVWTKALGPRTTARKNGTSYEINGFRLMEKLAPLWWPSKEAKAKPLPLEPNDKAAVERLHWFGQWHADGEQRRAVAQMRKVVTKGHKIDLLVQHYNLNLDGTPRCKPSWNDSIPVPHTAVRSEDGTLLGVWEFKPATFLDDLVDNWVDGGRPGVTLTNTQKNQLEELPWVKDWLRGVFTARERRRVLRNDASDSEDDGNTPCSKRTKGSDASGSVGRAGSSCAPSRAPSPSVASEWGNPPEERVAWMVH